KPQQRPADANGIACAERGRLGDAQIIHKSAAGRIEILDEITAAALDDAGVLALDAVVAEQANVASLGPANDDFGFAEDHFPAGPPAAFHPQPGLLQNHLRQPDEQADAQAEGDEAGRAGAPEFAGGSTLKESAPRLVQQQRQPAPQRPAQ